MGTAEQQKLIGMQDDSLSMSLILQGESPFILGEGPRGYRTASGNAACIIVILKLLLI